MSDRFFTVVAENGNKRLLRFFPEDDAGYCIVGATKEEIAVSFPDCIIDGMDGFLYTYLIEENGVIHAKGPDGVDITEELYGDGVFDKNRII